ncbi:hypothetical protein BVE84_06810 [Streptococcus azizii]|uniref:Beta-carotene 15,15'-monooxygenase n=1 Tax=Streptococcus azizii TaxID=1579424 RepID=A0AB36JPK4_9STRE|nr:MULTISPECIES: hypothetical protein [Streptococcus]MBF0775402.1 hypothetical protein [Streptococcus sp. 19428wD3_AN2]ONK26765.1 hypothetical protein BVE86_06630 [Streptococcus azizii]ONK27332.1 hypothetical protein BVE85_06615 [Streptococcus azizii]ONK28276.1 hypothetical protein BVE84_06810 [Streptococcus azizii]TFU84570.1 hypothetical protein E4T83_01235 [Streptococcus sp. AN2]
MDKILRIVKYIIALLPSMVTLTMIFVGILVLPTSFIPNLDIVASEIIYIVLLLIYGIRVSQKRIDKFYKCLYWIVGVLTILLFFIWSKKIFLIQPFQLLLYAGLCEGWLQDFRNYIKKNRDVFNWFNVYDYVFVAIVLFIGANQYILDSINNSIIKMLKSLDISTKHTEIVVIVLFLLCWFFLVPIIRASLGICFFRKQNSITLPANQVLWGTYLLGYFLSIISIALYLGIYFILHEANYNIGFILLVYNIYIATNALLWIPVYNSLNKLGQNKNKFISDLIGLILLLVAIVMIDQIESEIIGILTWFLPVLLPNFIGEIYKISDRYQQGHAVVPSLKMDEHLYWLTMISFNTLLVFNVISAFSLTDDGKHKFKEFLISILLDVIKQDTLSDIILRIFSSLIIVLFSLFLAWWLSKGIVKSLKNIYLDQSKGYFR